MVKDVTLSKFRNQVPLLVTGCSIDNSDVGVAVYFRSILTSEPLEYEELSNW